MKSLYQWSLLLVGLLAVAGCDKGGSTAEYKPEEIPVIVKAEIKPGEERKIFPMVRGNQWVYEVTSEVMSADGQNQKRSTELTFRCTNVYQQGNKTFATLEAVLDGQVNERQQWVFEEGRGLFQQAVGFPAKPFTPMQASLRFPIETGNKFVWEGTGYVPSGIVTKSKSESIVIGPQEVDTGEGRMEAIAVETTHRWSNGIALQTTWWTPGIGIARYRQEVRIADQTPEGIREAISVSVMRLKSKSLKDAE